LSPEFSEFLLSLPFFFSLHVFRINSCLLFIYFFIFKVSSTPNVGLELTTPRSRVARSTDGASQAPLKSTHFLKKFKKKMYATMIHL